MRNASTPWFGILAVVAGCASPYEVTDGGGTPPNDAGITQDAGTGGPTDSGNPSPDSGTPDAGTTTDAGGGVPGCVGVHPVAYDAPTDRLSHPAKPPPLGDAGTIWMDPVYGTPVLRLTDLGTLGGANVSYQVANEFGHNDWNTDATLFYIEAGSGGFLLFHFDPATMTASRVMSLATPTKPLAMPLTGQNFSRTDPNVLYGIEGYSIAQFDFSTQTTTTLLDLATLAAPPTDGGHAYVLGVEQGENGLLCTSFGGPEQDEMPYVATFDPTTGQHHLLDVQNATLDGVAVPSGPIGTGVHTITMDLSGQYVTFMVAGATPGSWVWDTTSQQIYPLAVGALGYGAWIHSRGSIDTDMVTYFTDPQDAGAVVTQNPNDSKAASSSSWENAFNGGMAPLIVETMRYPGDDAGWAAWDDELIAIRTDGTLNDAGQSDVYRFAHNFNDYDGGQYSDAFYYLYIPRVSQNGWFAIFDSNWMKSLGVDSNGNYRTDVFIAKLPNPCGP